MCARTRRQRLTRRAASPGAVRRGRGAWGKNAAGRKLFWRRPRASRAWGRCTASRSSARPSPGRPGSEAWSAEAGQRAEPRRQAAHASSSLRPRHAQWSQLAARAGVHGGGLEPAWHRRADRSREEAARSTTELRILPTRPRVFLVAPGRLDRKWVPLFSTGVGDWVARPHPPPPTPSRVWGGWVGEGSRGLG